MAVLATPGVYIEEKSGFSSSVVPVATAVPAFIGYTAKALRGTTDLTNVPTKISSLAEYEEIFGGQPKTKFNITLNSEKGAGYDLSIDESTNFKLHSSIRLFYSNGGGDCYIVSVGNYENGIKAKDFNDAANNSGLPTLLKYNEPTLLVIPEAALLSAEDCNSLHQAMLLHCGKDMRNRFAILDVHSGNNSRALTSPDEDVVNIHREGIGANFLQWGASYYPFLHTTIVDSSEIDFTNFNEVDALIEVLNGEVAADLEGELINESRANAIKGEIEKLSSAEGDQVESLQSTLKTISPRMNAILKDMGEMLNVLPPSAAIAGIYSMVDYTFNVSKAPANVSLGSVIKPSVNITAAEQEDLNLPLTGKAINAIRSFQGKGNLVWGARTLDGNSQDWRYIGVRRAMIFIEQSIKMAAEAYVFEPNNATTWSTLRATVSNFLFNQWQGGILAGANPEDAYVVEIGLGSTMTSNDILDGILKMTVKVAITRPAEFIVITFQQQQQKS